MQNKEPRKATLWQVIISVLGGFIGVQKSSVAQRDFEQPSPWIYVIVGIIATILFIVSLACIVAAILP